MRLGVLLLLAGVATAQDIADLVSRDAIHRQSAERKYAESSSALLNGLTHKRADVQLRCAELLVRYLGDMESLERFANKIAGALRKGTTPRTQAVLAPLLMRAGPKNVKALPDKPGVSRTSVTLDLGTDVTIHSPWRL